MIIQLVRHLREGTAKCYVIIDRKAKPLKTRTRFQLGTMTMGTLK